MNLFAEAKRATSYAAARLTLPNSTFPTRRAVNTSNVLNRSIDSHVTQVLSTNSWLTILTTTDDRRVFEWLFVCSVGWLVGWLFDWLLSESVSKGGKQVKNRCVASRYWNGGHGRYLPYIVSKSGWMDCERTDGCQRRWLACWLGR